MSWLLLEDAVVGGERPSQQFLWHRQDGQVEDLTDAVVRIVIQRDNERPFFSDGTVMVTNGAQGELRWIYGDNDLAVSGIHEVQMTAIFPEGLTPARTPPISWLVHPYLDPSTDTTFYAQGIVFGGAVVNGILTS